MFSAPCRRVLFGVSTLLVVLLSACGRPAPDGNKLVLLSPHSEGITQEFTTSFLKWYKAKHGVEVELEWLDQGGTLNVLRFTRSEFRKNPDGINVDVFFGGGTDIHLKMKAEGLLQPYRLPDEILSRIPQKYAGGPVYDPDFQWYGACSSIFGILYNKEQLDLLRLPNPETWADLAEPKLAGLVGSADPRQSGSVHMMYEIILQNYGWEKDLKSSQRWMRT